MKRVFRTLLVLVLILPYLLEPSGLGNAASGEPSASKDLRQVEEYQVNEPTVAEDSQNFENEETDEPYIGEIFIQKEGLLADDSVSIEDLQDNESRIIVPVAAVLSSGTVGDGGAPWELFDDGVLEVGAGFINWIDEISPWHAYRDDIREIAFTAPITAGTSLFSLFHLLENVTTIEGLDNFDTSQVMDMGQMFYRAERLTSLDLSNWDTSQVINTNAMFYGASNLVALDVSGWDTSSVSSMSSMFQYASSLTTIDVSNWDTSSVTHMPHMFFRTDSLTNLDVSNWDTSSVISMDYMFYGASSLMSLDVSNWDTSNVINMEWMFNGASSLASLDVSNWDTNSVISMSDMFSAASSLTSLDVSNWDTSNVVNMEWMFRLATGLTELDVSNWDTSNVTYMSFMFAWAESLTNLDVSDWDTGNVIDMTAMFAGASSLVDLDLSSWSTGNVTNMQSVFEGASGLTSLDITGWDTSSVTNMASMFSRMESLISLDLSSFDTGSVTNMTNMFYATILLNELSLGTYFEFRGHANLPSIFDDGFTGYWQNIGDGTIVNPQGEFVFTSTELMEEFDGSIMADTFVWQREAHLIELAPTGDHDFGTETVGYTGIEPHTVTIRNIGSQPTGILAITLSGGDAENFIIDPTSISNILPSENETFVIRPTDDLLPGTYTARVTVDGGENIIAQSFNVSFTVVEEEATLILTPSTIDVNDANLVASSNVGGTASGITELDTTDLPERVTAVVDNDIITVTGQRPAEGQADIVGEFEITVTRQGLTETLTVNVNLTASVGTTEATTDPTAATTSPICQPGQQCPPVAPSQPWTPSQPGTSGQPNLPQAGIIVGVSVLGGGSTLLALGLTIIAKKKNTEKE